MAEQKQRSPLSEIQTGRPKKEEFKKSPAQKKADAKQRGAKETHSSGWF